MRHINRFGVLFCALPLVVLLAGIVRIHPEAAVEFDRLCETSQEGAAEWGRFLLGKCRLD